MQNNIQPPLFAPAGGQNSYEEIDINEIFADYFSNEFDADPLAAYTGLTNPGPVVNVGLSAPQVFPGLAGGFSGGMQFDGNGGQLNLPTGGIRTSFHGVGNGATGPDSKRQRVDQSTNTMSEATANASLATASQALSNAQNTLAQNLAHAQARAAVTASVGGMQLPVGVGIKLGGVGGIAPSQAQAPLLPYATASDASNYEKGGTVSEERRQKNREHAKRSRVRKKFMLESLQEEVKELQRENQNLRMLVQEHMPEDAMKIFSECCTSGHLFDDQVDNEDSSGYKSETMVSADQVLMKSLTMGQQNFVLSDPKLPDNPIVFASPGFYELTGYTSQEVLGRNCRFLQGPGTDPKSVEVIRKAVATGSDASICLLNYKADGTPFWNQFFIAALRDSDNQIVNFVGVQTEVRPEVGNTSLEERVNSVLPLNNKEDDSQEDDY